MEYSVGAMVLDNWKIVQELGAGAFGTVYEIKKNEFGVTTRSALKVIRIPHSTSDLKAAVSDGLDDQSVRNYFYGLVSEIVKEVSVMSSLKSHPNIVSYEDHSVLPHPGEIGWDILIRMELLTPMPDYLLSNSIDESAVIRLGIDLTSALSFCEQKSLIHRDIKPENIFISEAGLFKLGDFGVARTAEKTASGLSKKGTESYMAPEVYLGQSYGPTVDLYSLGLVLYKLLNRNRLPFFPAYPQPITYIEREQALERRIRGEPLPPPCCASPELSSIVLRACSYYSKNRFRNADEMQAALLHLIRPPANKGSLPPSLDRVELSSSAASFSEHAAHSVRQSSATSERAGFTASYVAHSAARQNNSKPEPRPAFQRTAERPLDVRSSPITVEASPEMDRDNSGSGPKKGRLFLLLSTAVLIFVVFLLILISLVNADALSTPLPGGLPASSEIYFPPQTFFLFKGAFPCFI